MDPICFNGEDEQPSKNVLLFPTEREARSITSRSPNERVAWSMPRRYSERGASGSGEKYYRCVCERKLEGTGGMLECLLSMHP